MRARSKRRKEGLGERMKEGDKAKEGRRKERGKGRGKRDREEKKTG